MSKQRMIVTDDQLLIDMDLLFNAIREADDWQEAGHEPTLALFKLWWVRRPKPLPWALAL
jgi:hypothetical protein